MRKIRVYRHSLRDGHFISPEGVDLINSVVAKLQEEKLSISKVLYSSYIRSLQTAAYLAIGLGHPEMISYQIPELSGKKSDEIFFSNDAFMEEYQNNTGEDLTLVVRKHLNPEQISDIEEESAKTIRICFAHISHGQTAIAVGHTPYISMAADYFNERDTEIRVEGKQFENGHFCGLKEMEYIDFIID